MNKGSIRAFAAGIILSTAVIAGYQYWFEPKDKAGMDLHHAKNTLEQEGFQVTKETEQEKPPETDNGQNTKSAKKQQDNKDVPATTEKNAKKNEGTQASAEKDKGPAATYTLTIQSGMTSGEIAQLLVKENILKDASLFEEYMNKNDLSKQIQIGEYVVTNNMTVQQVAKTITK